MVPFLVLSYNQPLSASATMVNNILGAGFLLAVLGGFVADTFLGGFYTVVLGGICMISVRTGDVMLNS